MNLPNELKTVSGLRVIGVTFKEKNSAGMEVTFPIKGSIVLQEKPLKLEYNCWAKNGRISLWKKSKKDLDI
jgi:hypothetical protein